MLQFCWFKYQRANGWFSDAIPEARTVFRSPGVNSNRFQPIQNHSNWFKLFLFLHIYAYFSHISTYLHLFRPIFMYLYLFFTYSWVLGRMGWVLGWLSWVLGTLGWFQGQLSWVLGPLCWVLGRLGLVQNPAAQLDVWILAKQLIWL